MTPRIVVLALLALVAAGCSGVGETPSGPSAPPTGALDGRWTGTLTGGTIAQPTPIGAVGAAFALIPEQSGATVSTYSTTLTLDVAGFVPSPVVVNATYQDPSRAASIFATVPRSAGCGSPLSVDLVLDPSGRSLSGSFRALACSGAPAVIASVVLSR